MKLSNQQLEAVVERVLDLRRKKLESTAPTKHQILLAKKIRNFGFQFYRSLPKSEKNRFDRKLGEKNLHYWLSLAGFNPPSLNSYMYNHEQRQKIRNEILLASIDTATLEELCTKMKVSL